MADIDNTKHATLRFEVGAQLVLTLGRDLITDSTQAVMELVKNAYDADSIWAEVVIDTNAISEDHNSFGAVGFISVSDWGHGMSLEDIKRGWLTIAQSQKRKMKEEGRKTKNTGRTPLGSKGLGRLGAQALGRYVQIVTRPQDSEYQLTVWIDWQVFERELVLSEITFNYSTHPRGSEDEDGTTITIWGLHSPAQWALGERKLELQERLARIISPFKAIKDFLINVTVNGKKIELLELKDDVRTKAATNFTFLFSGNILEIEGVVKLDYCRPMPKSKIETDKMRSRFATFVSSDGGEKFLTYLIKKTARMKGKSILVERSEKDGWFIKGTVQIPLEEFDKHERANNRAISPGDFCGEIDTFIFSGSSELVVSDQVKTLIKTFNGIRVYRDGFGIKLHDDWLGLSRFITQGGSYFELKKENSWGYVEITAEKNDQLEETADRQRFQEDSSAYKNFYLLMSEVVRFVGSFQELIRRGIVDFLKDEEKNNAGIDPTLPSSKIVERFDTFVSNAKIARVRSENQTIELKKTRDRIVNKSSVDLKNLKAVGGTESQVEDIQNLFNELEKTLNNTQQALESVEVLLAQVEGISEMKNLLVERIESLNEQSILLHETAGLGLSAEIISHEVTHIAEGILARSAHISRSIQNDKIDPKYLSFVEHVRTQTSALQLQTSHLAPSLRFIRDRKSVLNVRDIVGNLVEYHRDRLTRKDISILLNVEGNANFLVYLNQGRLTQVIDNVIINAEYWAAENLRQNTSKEGLINITIKKPFIQITDSGRGVDPSVEDILFEQPFITKKKEGRGLGLFICRKLLESIGCGIYLVPTRNKEGRLYTFEIDLSGAIHDGK